MIPPAEISVGHPPRTVRRNGCSKRHARHNSSKLSTITAIIGSLRWQASIINGAIAAIPVGRTAAATVTEVSVGIFFTVVHKSGVGRTEEAVSLRYSVSAPYGVGDHRAGLTSCRRRLVFLTVGDVSYL